MNSDPARELDEKYAPQLEYFSDRSNLLFSYHFFILEFREDEDLNGDLSTNDRTWMLQTMKNACLHTTLMALRDLDEFFNPEKAYNTDLRAADFGLDESRQFLTATEREQINPVVSLKMDALALARLE